MNANQYKIGKITLPAWLDSRTVAILGMILTGTLGLGTMMRADMGQMRADIRADMGQVRTEMGQVRTEMGQVRTDMNQMRQELRADIAKLDDRLRVVEIDVTAIRTGLEGFEARLGAVERHARHLATPGHPES